MSEKLLVIAEKPSVAADIARALGGLKREGEYFEGEQFVVSSAVGHLLELVVPDKYDVKRGKWSFDHLPMIPPSFDLKPIKKTEDRLKVLKRLLKRKDIVGVINACDAGREGELIFRYIMQAAKCKKTIQRLWLQSMTPASIREAFQNLRTDEQMQNLADAARSRSEADWLVGINGTRAMTAFNSKDGGFFLTTVGRVQTPTLAIVVEREEKIQDFISQKYWEVHCKVQAQAGDYESVWINPAFEKSSNAQAKPERIWDEATAKTLCSKLQGQLGTVKETAKRTRQLSPLLFDLTSLQREANSRFGFSAKSTLAIAQSLYEKHKALTYPRTDARALPEDYLGTVHETLQMLSHLENYQDSVSKINDNQWVKQTKRIFDNSKISDHFAIIPTLQLPKKLSEPEEKIYDLVVKRFLSVFFPAAEYDVTTRLTYVDSEVLKTEGKVLVEPGWLSVYGRFGQSQEDVLVPVAPDESVQIVQARQENKATKPPARYNEATLLSAMEGAGKLVEEEGLREAMAGKGLGTPATRAAIIEGLLMQKYIRREGRDLVPTFKARQLFALLKGLSVSELSEPELTGEWEFKLAQIEQGKLKRDDFMKEIRSMTEAIVDAAKRFEGDTVPIENPAHLKTPCPKCGGEIVENYRRFACTQCDFSLSKHPGGRTFEVEEVEQLLQNGRIGPLQGFISKMGRPFEAELRITPDFKMEFDFGEDANTDVSEIDFSDCEMLGQCPKCQGRVFATSKGYLCEHTKDKLCDFRVGKTILQQELDSEQVRKLLNEGRTDELGGFVSNRTKRKFSAKLIMQGGGKLGFEFAQVKSAKSKTLKK